VVILSIVVEAMPTAGQGTVQPNAFYERSHDRVYFCDLHALAAFGVEFTHDVAVP